MRALQEIRLPQPPKQNEPLLSLIIPTRNRAKYLERCLSSVFHEIETTYPRTEVIIIDGGSTDGTIEILKRYSDRISYWVSEPDSGVAEAVNKGIANARGEIIRFLGDDDELIPGWSAYMVRYLVDHSEVDVLLAHGEYYAQGEMGEIARLEVNMPSGRLTYRNFFTNPKKIFTVAPEMQFTRRRVFEKYGGYNESYRYLGCGEMWLRHAKSGVVFEAIPKVITKRYITRDSDNVRGEKQVFEQEFCRMFREQGDFLALLLNYYPMRIKHTLLRPITKVCGFLNFHPLRTLRWVRARLWTIGKA